MIYIKRHIEQIINKISSKKLVIVLTGPRQVGKSTMLKAQFKNHVYLTLDTPSILESAKDNPVGFINRYPSVIIDEIQKAPEIFNHIKEVVDEVIFECLEKGKPRPICKYILTGSQSFALMENVDETLAGRTAVISMNGLSKRELNGLDFTEPFLPTQKQLETKDALNTIAYDYNRIIDIIHKGSLPELHQMKFDLDEWSVFMDSYIKTYIEKDVRRLINIKDETAFMKFLRATAARTGQQLNLAAMAEAVGKDAGTMKSWLAVLQTSGLIYLLEPYSSNHSKRLTRTPKMYFMDSGLACFLAGWRTPEQLTLGASWGSIFETWVISEIVKSYYNSGKSLLPLYYYRDKDMKEIDLIIEDGDTLYPIEIKATTDPLKKHLASFDVLKNISNKQIGEGAVICLCKQSFPMHGGNWATPVDLI